MRLEELKTERRFSKKKIEHFLKKISEEILTFTLTGSQRRRPLPAIQIVRLPFPPSTVYQNVDVLKVAMKTEVPWERDVLRGDDAYELQVKLLKQIPKEYPYKDDE